MFEICPGCKVFHSSKTFYCDACGYLDAPSVDDIVRAVARNRASYEAYIRQQNTKTWTPDQRTLDIYCLGRWLNDLLASGDDENRRRLLWYFNRIVRAEQDPFEAMRQVLGCLNSPLPTHYQTFSRSRR